MADIVLFHSILGLRAIEHDLAREWESAGHTVHLPDLFGGHSAEDYDGGFAIRNEVGADYVAERARAAVAAAPDTAVLAGVSMGAGHIGDLWGERPLMAGALLIAGIADWAEGMRADLPVSCHIARPDPFDDEDYFADWRARTPPGVRLDLQRYDGVGHYFIDPALPDFGAPEAKACRAAMLRFLNEL